MIQRLFVYGTLCPGRPNEHVLTAIGGTWEQATVRGTLREEGWGADMGYPGIFLDDVGDSVEGYIFCSDKLESHWADLDAFEGEEYQRVLVKAITIDRKVVDATIYAL